MKICDRLDSYRDGELSGPELEEFRRHLGLCAECARRLAVLNRVVVALRQESLPVTDLADRIVRRAFQRVPAWDELLAAWFRPRWAFAAFGLTMALAAFLWFTPAGPANVLTEYDALLQHAESSNPADELLTASENDFALTLVQGGLNK